MGTNVGLLLRVCDKVQRWRNLGRDGMMRRVFAGPAGLNIAKEVIVGAVVAILTGKDVI